MTDRFVAPSPSEDEAQYEAGLRPRSLNEYIGQDRLRDNLHVSIAAARGRREALLTHRAVLVEQARQHELWGVGG